MNACTCMYGHLLVCVCVSVDLMCVCVCVFVCDSFTCREISNLSVLNDLANGASHLIPVSSYQLGQFRIFSLFHHKPITSSFISVSFAVGSGRFIIYYFDYDSKPVPKKCSAHISREKTILSHSRVNQRCIQFRMRDDSHSSTQQDVTRRLTSLLFEGEVYQYLTIALIRMFFVLFCGEDGLRRVVQSNLLSVG